MKSIARLKKIGKEFEIVLEDVEKAIELREKLKKSISEAEFIEAINLLSPSKFIFLDEKKGLKASNTELYEAFGSTDFYKIAKEILSEGEIVLPTEYRNKLREEKTKQIIAWLSRNTIDPRTKALHTPERIEAAMKEAGVKVDEFKPIDTQISSIIHQLSRVLPMKIENRKIEINVPAVFVGKVYSIIAKYEKIKEEWLEDGSLKATLILPAALLPDFYDKLNKATHGTALTKDLGEA
jgi:ribosome maturation protein SDO1